MRAPPIAKRMREASLKRSPIRKIMELADRKNIVNLGLDPDEVISFAGGWVNHTAPRQLREAYAAIAADGQRFHETGAYSPTAGIPALKKMLVRLDRELYATGGLSSDHVIIGQSSSQLTFDLFVTLLDPGDAILLFDPAYANYPPQIGVYRDDLRALSLPVLDRESWTYFDDEATILGSLAEILARQQPKMLLFSSPDNPTGQLVPDGAFDKVLELAGDAGCFVAVDYAYRAQYFTDEQPGHFSASPEVHPHLVKIHSNSKWCRGLGRRLGWIEADPEIVAALTTVQQSTSLCPDTLHQVALADYLQTALDDGSLRTYLDDAREAYGHAAEFMADCIERYLGMRYLRPRGGLYTVVDVGRDAEEFVQEVLENTGVVFVPGGGFGATLRNAIRVSFGPLVNDLPRMEEGFARVRDYLGCGG